MDIKKDNLWLMQGDCLDRMKEIPSGSVDMILTDPPYGMEFQSNYRNEKYSKIKNDKDLSWLSVWVDELFRVAADNTAHYVFCSFHNIDKFKQALEQRFKIRRTIQCIQFIKIKIKIFYP